jgi:hypothetical protein
LPRRDNDIDVAGLAATLCVATIGKPIASVMVNIALLFGTHTSGIFLARRVTSLAAVRRPLTTIAVAVDRINLAASRSPCPTAAVLVLRRHLSRRWCPAAALLSADPWRSSIRIILRVF